jgi:putative ABC transport system substrate-binding protein
MKRRELMALIGGFAIAWSFASYSQQPIQNPPKRVGLLAQGGCPITPDNPITRRLAELGWVEGQNFVFDCVSTVDRLDQVPALAENSYRGAQTC